MRQDRWACKPCGKTAYESRSRAESAIRRIRGYAIPGKQVPTRTYECPYKNGWHLTSKAMHSVSRP